MKVFLLAALTADGFIGRTADHLANWTSPEDKKLFVRLTKQAGAFVMGSRTFATIGRALPGRRNIILTTQPEKFAGLDVEATSDTPQALVDRLRAEGQAELAICGGASVYRQFMQAGLVDELYLTIEPLVFGTGLSLFDQPLESKLELLEFERLNEAGTVLLHYGIVR